MKKINSNKIKLFLDGPKINEIEKNMKLKLMVTHLIHHYLKKMVPKII